MAISVPPPSSPPPAQLGPGDLTPASSRLDRVRQVEHRPRRASRAATLESLAVFLVFGAIYFVVGYRVLTENQVVVFDAVDRLNRALMVFWDAPPKLAAVGFTFPPFETLVMLPFAIFKPLASSLIALPLASAVFGGGTIAILGMTLRRCEMPALLRYPLLIAFAVNPLFGFYATNGMADMPALFFLACAIYCAIAWSDDRSTLYLIGAGVSMSLAILTHYGIAAFGVVLAVMFATSMSRRSDGSEDPEEDHPSRVEATVITYAMPIIYAVALWTLLNALIVNSPFGWIGSKGTDLAVNADQAQTAESTSFGGIVSRTFEVVLHTAPIALLLIPALAVLAFAGKDGRALRGAILVAVGVLLVGAQAVLSDDVGRVVLRNGLPVALVAVLIAANTYRAMDGLRLIVYGVTLVLVLIAIPLSWSSMKSYPFQNQEQAFTRALRTGDDLTGRSSIGGYTIGLSSERSMAAFIKRTVGEKKHSVLADNAQTYPVIALTGRPKIFRDRVQRGDGYFKDVLNRPWGKVDYILVASQARADLVRLQYPQAASGGVAGLSIVFTTDRYVLLKVSRTRPPRRARPSPQAQQESRSPQFTPLAPPTVPSDSAPADATSTSATTPAAPATGTDSTNDTSTVPTLGTTVPQGASTTTTTPQTRTTP